MTFASRLLPYVLVVAMTGASAVTPCDFKGVSVGDRTTPAALMAAFGVKEFKKNPPRTSSDELLKLGKKYGLMAAAEIDDWNIGPACDESRCRIPFGVGVGNNNSPVSVFVSFPGGLIKEIDVSFNETFWDDIKPILDQKYGGNWRSEVDPDFLITDLETKEHVTVERQILNHKTNGRNPKTGSSCMIWAVNFDVIFQHHDPLGTYHSEFVIKLVSANF